MTKVTKFYLVFFLNNIWFIKPTLLLKFIIIANTNKLVNKVCIINKQTWIINYKSITVITRLSKRVYSNL